MAISIDEYGVHAGDVQCSIEEFLDISRCSPEVALPDGTKFVENRANTTVVVHQQPPSIRLVRWTTDDSPAYGDGVKYRKIKIAVPYTILVCVFSSGKLTKNNELYFSNESIKSRDSKLLFPALLNVSVMKHLANEHTWVCTQYYKGGGTWPDQVDSLINHVWNGGFNRSSEAHEGESWFGRSSKQVDEVSTIQKWEEWTEKEPRMVTSVPWIPSGKTVGDVIEFSFKRTMTVDFARFIEKSINTIRRRG